jgi:hypothetical protein
MTNVMTHSHDFATPGTSPFRCAESDELWEQLMATAQLEQAFHRIDPDGP